MRPCTVTFISYKAIGDDTSQPGVRGHIGRVPGVTHSTTTNARKSTCDTTFTTDGTGTSSA